MRFPLPLRVSFRRAAGYLIIGGELAQSVGIGLLQFPPNAARNSDLLAWSYPISLAISAGAHAKVVQRQLGHKSAALTLGHLRGSVR
jgi:hypothetical protein